MLHLKRMGQSFLMAWALALLAIAPLTARATTYTVTTWAELQTALGEVVLGDRITITGDITLGGDITVGSNFTFEIPAGSSLTTGGYSVTSNGIYADGLVNEGTINNNGGTISVVANSGNLDNAGGTINNSNGGAIIVNGGEIFNTGGTINNTGGSTITIISGEIFNYQGLIYTDETSSFSGHIFLNVPPTITPSLPDGVLGVAYSQSLTASSGDTPITWSLASGSLPDGLTLDSDGQITGSPTTAQTSSFVVQADNVGGYSRKQLSIKIGPPSSTVVSPASVPALGETALALLALALLLAGLAAARAGRSA